MVNALVRYQQTIAWVFTGIFYLQLIATPIAAKAAMSDRVTIPNKKELYRSGATGKKMDIQQPFLTDDAVEAKKPASAANNSTAKTPLHLVADPATVDKKFTGGPSQPEMQSFQSVNANNLVDLFTGDFSYNIPLLDVGGYPVNLHYSSGITMDQEASWVGLGWNVNPGTVNRNMRGLPDDFKGEADQVEKTVSIKPNRTIGINMAGDIELLGVSKLPKMEGTLGVNYGIFHNTYKGWGTEYGLSANLSAGIGAKGKLTGGLGVSNNSQSGLNVSPSFGFHLGKQESIRQGGITIGTTYNSRVGIQELQITGEMRQQIKFAHSQKGSVGAPISSSISFSRPSYTPSITMPYTSRQYSYSAKLGDEKWVLHASGAVKGYLSLQQIDKEDKTKKVPAYGYLYYEQAKGNQDVLLDFNREKDISYQDSTPHIAVPIYTYDTYSITGEGTGGMFRPYRSDIGFVHDNKMATKSVSGMLSYDVGIGSVVHAGIDLNGSKSTTTSGPWMSDNALKDVTRFHEKDSSFENVYFKNPGEKGVVDANYLQKIGDDKLMRIDLSPLDLDNQPVVSATRNFSLFKNARKIETSRFTDTSLRKERDKRTQLISYLTAAEAKLTALDPILKNYPINVFPNASCNVAYSTLNRVSETRKEHHLSEITVLNPDGRRYVYGLPVYNITQVEGTMSIGKQEAPGGLGAFEGDENSKENHTGKEAYYTREVIPSYAHSFLLTSIVSPDYADLTGDGISDDDNGDAVKFNYSQAFTADKPYQWRAPYGANHVAYNEGLKTDKRDEKGSYTYGQREVWYLNSIESKTMIATFILDTDNLRKDAIGVASEDGGMGTNQQLYRLKQINLYTKADYLKYQGGEDAKPIKSVHFEYGYDLCKKTPGSLHDTVGKLTLRKVWFTYNKNNKGSKNTYTFSYNNKDLPYKHGNTDRWGNYKDPSNNPGNGQKLTNADYAYSLQESSTWTKDSINKYVAPWTLSEVKLPSGGKINVSYESDDYAFVQNKRAMQFFVVEGLSETQTGTPANRLHKPNAKSGDYYYVHVRVPDAVTTKEAIRQKYLDGIDQLFFKLAVNMPADKWGKGYEYVPSYAKIDDYGVDPVQDPKRIWIKIKPMEQDNTSPLTTAAIQFLRLNLPSKAYPYSEPGDDLSINSLVGMLLSVFRNISNAAQGFEGMVRSKNWINSIETDRSFVRLNNPFFKKYGGGLRVKKVEISDNWKAMTADKQVESIYGQEYTYTTTAVINGDSVQVSSGVAAYEPSVGNDENPFHIPLKIVSEKIGKFAPVDYTYTEEPFAETFFPAPMVGYSKVKVQTIHKTKKSANGWEETEFYTTRDFPTQVEITPMEKESKKTFNPKLINLFKFFIRNYVTLTQGFKVELNDMNGKIKSQVSYAQNDTINPLSYTYNYYRLEKDNSLQPKLSNKVTVIDDANGALRPNAEIGKEVEIMIDLREQVTQTYAGHVQLNIDVANIFPPVVFPSVIPIPTYETSQYRSVAVTKVVNRYGILDSVIHIEKGSQVTTRDLVYDAETGQTLLTRTNNEFDDPVYNFQYPAHWAYSGMSLAYKNTGLILSNKTVRQGIMYNMDGTRCDVKNYFESGDEILIQASGNRVSTSTDSCTPSYYTFDGELDWNKIWAIDASKGYQKHTGLYFIDKEGAPYNGEIAYLKVIRSGKRNMASTPLGSITSLEKPVKNIAGKEFIYFDSTSAVVAVSAARFKDFWKIDNVWKEYDSCGFVTKTYTDLKLNLETYLYRSFVWLDERGRPIHKIDPVPFNRIVAGFQFSNKTYHTTRSLIRIKNIGEIPQNAVITRASFALNAGVPTLAWDHSPWKDANFNYSYTAGGTGTSFVGQIFRFPFSVEASGYTPWVSESRLFQRVPVIHQLNYAGSASTCVSYPGVEIKASIQQMLPLSKEYHTLILKVPGDEKPYFPNNGQELRFMSFVGKDDTYASKNCGVIAARLDPNACPASCPATITVDYQVAEKFCYKVCRSEVAGKDTLNPYRYGILGNWRVDTTYTYYANRKETNPAVATNIRKDGTIEKFIPYWTLGNVVLTPRPDTTRWTWTSKTTLINGKGMEIESKDPLGRYAAGLYGYNRTLPIAVAQNSKHREIVFDGFEDNDYKSNPCATCNDNGWVKMNSGQRTQDYSHSGKYSYYIAGNTSSKTEVPIVTAAADSAEAMLSLKVDSQVQLISQRVVPKGTGLNTRFGIWFAINSPKGINNCIHQNVSTLSPSSLWWSPDSIVSVPDVLWGDKEHPAQVCSDSFYMVRWKGKIQAPRTGLYRFRALANDNITLIVDGTTLIATNNSGADVAVNSPRKQLTGGQLYDIEITLYNITARSDLKLLWSMFAGTSGFTPIPAQCLYQNASQAAGSVINDTTWCVKFRSPHAINAIHNKFSPIQSRKMVVSGWVKEASACIDGTGYKNSRVRLTFNNGSSVNYDIRPDGNIIEGWQRFEKVIDIPAGVSIMNVFLETTSGTAAYFDDLRVHPFNSNMRSFVYDAQNLRLMAELDENNYASYYEYDDEGTLIRVKKETERGIKTIKETRSALLKN